MERFNSAKKSTATSAMLSYISTLTNHAMNSATSLGPSTSRTGSTSSCETKEAAAPSATTERLEEKEETNAGDEAALLHLLVSQDLALSAQGNLGLD